MQSIMYRVHRMEKLCIMTDLGVYAKVENDAQQVGIVYVEVEHYSTFLRFARITFHTYCIDVILKLAIQLSMEDTKAQ